MGKLRVESIGKAYIVRQGWGAPSVYEVFRDVSFTLDEGAFVSLIGPSGCGKTTALNLVAGLVAPTEGNIYIDGKQVRGPGLDRGIVFQDFALFPWLTVASNIAFGLKSMGVSRADIALRVKQLIHLVGLEGFADYHPNRLSGGMRQRVGIGRALATDPAVLLMDEPFGSLDSQTRESMQNALVEIWSRTRKAVLFVTHDIREAVFLSDRVIVMNGRPARVTLDLPIDLPRPRARRDPGFQKLEELLEQAIYDSPQSAA